MSNRPGYKHTSLGWIPKEWEVVRLGQLCQITSSKRILAEEYCPKGIPFYRSKEIIEKINGLNHDEVLFISNERYENILQRFGAPNEGDILMTAVGSLGKSYIVKKSDLPFYFKDGNLLWFKDFKKGINKQFLINYFNSILFQREIELSTYGSSQKALTIETLSDFEVPIPPLNEKNGITEIFSTWDKAITKTQQLILQMQQRNKGLMQQLLTSKKRLKGFEGEWKRLHIYDVAKEVSLKNRENKELTVLSCTKYDGLVPSLEYFGRRVFGSDTSTYKVVPLHHFAYATNHIEEGSIGYQNIFEEALISPMYTVFKTNCQVHDDYLFKLLKSHHYVHEYCKRMEGSIDRRGGLRWDEFSKIVIHFPELKEQVAIASLLNKATEEIKLYEKKLAAIQKQKKGLMQKLLTGEVRVKTDS